MKLLVVDALTLGDRARRELTRDFIGAGPRMVAATLRAGGNDVTLQRGEDFLGTGVARGFDGCFVSGMTMDLRSVLQVATTFKRASKGFVVVGGPVALEPAKVLREACIDAVVPGEIERVLLNALARDRIDTGARGFVTRKTVEDPLVLDRPPVSFIERVDPAIDLLPRSYDNFWAARVYIEVLRGCSNVIRARIRGDGRRACTGCGFCDQEGPLDPAFACPAGQPPGCGFCSTVPVSGPVRSFSIPYITGQVHDAIKAGCHRIVLGGSDFLEFQREHVLPAGTATPAPPSPPNHDALRSLVASLRRLPGVDTGDVQLFIENVKASLCDDEALSILANIPGVSLSVGIESGSDQHLERLGKATTVSTIKAAIDGFKHHGIRYHAYFIHSLPGQAKQDVAASIALMRWMETRVVDKITLYKFKPLPFTAFSTVVESRAASKDSSRLIREARRINEARKDTYVSRTVKVLVAEADFRAPGDAVAYMLEGGPKVKLPGAASLVGDKKVHIARITGVISDKMTTGLLVDGG